MLDWNEPTLPTGVLPPPETRGLFERREEIRDSYSAYVKATEDMQAYGANFTSRDEAVAEAYARRAAAIKAAIGVDLEVPLSAFEGDDRTLPFEERTLRVRQKKFDERLRELQTLHPDQAAVIRADVPIERDAEEITRGAVAGMAEAERKAENLPWGLRTFGALEGSVRGMLRDPVQIYTLGFGAGSKAVTAGGRILSVALTEAAVNGAAEIPVQLAAENWRRQSGVPLGWKGSLQQVGLAALFGGGFGGLLQGGSEVLKSLGKATPATDAALARMKEGNPTVEDVKLISDAVGTKIDEPDLKALGRAIEDDADDAAVLAAGVDGKTVAQVARAIEDDLPVPLPARAAGDIPVEAAIPPARLIVEPATPEAADAAAQALQDAGGAKIAEAAAPDADAVKVEVPGLEPITLKAQAEPAEKALSDVPPAGQMFAPAEREKLDLMDALPAGNDVEGRPVLTTHAELASRADRTDYLADVVLSCKG